MNSDAKYTKLTTRLWEFCFLLLVAIWTVSFIESAGTADMRIWLRWMQSISKYGLIDGYGASQGDYPPLCYGILFLGNFVSSLLGLSQFLTLKIFLLINCIFCATVIGRYSRNLMLAIIALAILASYSVGLNYLDILYAPWLLLSLLLLKKRSYGFGLLLYTAACMIKWQPVVLAPLILIFLFRQQVKEKKSVLNLGPSLIPSIAFLAGIGVSFGMPIINAFRDAMSHSALSANALNIGWIITYFQEPHSASELVQIVRATKNQFVFANVLFFALYILLCLRSVLSKDFDFSNLIFKCILGFFSYFLIKTGVHENHLFIPVLLSFLIVKEKPYLNMTVGISLLFLINLFTFYSYTGDPPLVRTVLGFDLSILYSAVAVLMAASIWFMEFTRFPVTLSLRSSK